MSQRQPTVPRWRSPGIGVALMILMSGALAACTTSEPLVDTTTAETTVPTVATTASATTTVAETTTTAADDTAPVFVGEFAITPTSGPIGTTVTATGAGFPTNRDLVVAWEDTTGSWLVDLVAGTYSGREYLTVARPLQTVTTDSTGAFTMSFEVPADFGWTHNVTVQEGDAILNRAGFRVDMEVSITPNAGPVGTPITIEVRGMGYAYLENSWQLSYDNSYTGWVSSVTTDGFATAVIPATGEPGPHVIQLTHGWSHVPYLNNQQSPRPDRPVFTFVFNVTDEPAVLPAAAETQGLALVTRDTPPDDGAPAIWTDLVSGPVGTPLTIFGRNLPSGELALKWYRQEGNRVSGSGFEEAAVDLGTVTAAGDGTIAFVFSTLDDLGGVHRIEAVRGDEVLAATEFDVKPSAFAVENGRGPVGTMALFHLKGVGWTETANIYTVVYDNSYIGFACAFNSQGDVQVFLPLAGEPGYHFVDFYPAIYRGEDIRGAVNFRIPQLTFAEDHPGEVLPAFRFVVEVTEG